MNMWEEDHRRVKVPAGRSYLVIVLMYQYFNAYCKYRTYKFFNVCSASKVTVHFQNYCRVIGHRVTDGLLLFY